MPHPHMRLLMSQDGLMPGPEVTFTEYNVLHPAERGSIPVRHDDHGPVRLRDPASAQNDAQHIRNRKTRMGQHRHHPGDIQRNSSGFPAA